MFQVKFERKHERIGYVSLVGEVKYDFTTLQGVLTSRISGSMASRAWGNEYIVSYEQGLESLLEYGELNGIFGVLREKTPWTGDDLGLYEFAEFISELMEWHNGKLAKVTQKENIREENEMKVIIEYKKNHEGIIGKERSRGK